MNLKNKEIISEMMRSADEFLTIGYNSKTFIPNFVNIAFSCELYLKSILLYTAKSKIKTHDLNELYEEIIKYIDEESFLKVLREEISKDPLYSVDDTRRDLISMLSKHKKLFVEWRYIFEGKVEKPYIVDLVLINFAEALRKFANDMV